MRKFFAAAGLMLLAAQVASIAVDLASPPYEKCPHCGGRVQLNREDAGVRGSGDPIDVIRPVCLDCGRELDLRVIDR
jgi:hypothetical protein